MGPDLGVIWLIIMTVSICAVIFGMRYMSSKENLSMIEKGLDPKIKPERPRPAPFRSLKMGLLLVGAGLGLFAAYLLDNTVLYHVGHYSDKWDDGGFRANGANVSIYFALIAIGGGLGLITSYRIEKKELLDKQDKL
jgi:multisubunit Na+/H+ antiporter MnhB subunit